MAIKIHRIAKVGQEVSGEANSFVGKMGSGLFSAKIYKDIQFVTTTIPDKDGKMVVLFEAYIIYED